MARSKKKVTAKVKRFIDWVNKKFPAESPGYDVAFVIVDDDKALITSESFAEHVGRVVDYYGEHRSTDSDSLWIHPVIQKEADKRGLFLEWENSAAVSVTEA